MENQIEDIILSASPFYNTQRPGNDTGGNLDISKETQDPKNTSSDGPCELCCMNNSGGRNLVVCLDGTSNKFGAYNSNVVELYSRLVKDETQLTYYNSGIGTHVTASRWLLTRFFQRVQNAMDMAFAQSFEKILFAAYQWLVNHYRPGDRIYLFGFSRGAYIVRTLAAMIQKVGVLHAGNVEQIPFAYELYRQKKNDKNLESFKKTFSWDPSNAHFVGVWDTVSSIGFIRRDNLPGTDEFNDDGICYFRHALALDEQRVKFLPEFVCGGSTYPPRRRMIGAALRPLPNGKAGPRVKEVWFPGCHSDIGGGNVNNKELNNATIPELWLANQGRMAGLKLTPSSAIGEWSQLKATQGGSMGRFWPFYELLPSKHLTYKDTASTTRVPHRFRGRVILPGQKIHASVCFIPNYTPKATFDAEMEGANWGDILLKGDEKDTNWLQNLPSYVELDLFDTLSVKEFISRCIKGLDKSLDSFCRLEFLSCTREGAQAILNEETIHDLLRLIFLHKEGAFSRLFHKLIPHDTNRSIILRGSYVQLIDEMGPYHGDWITKILGTMAYHYGALPLTFIQIPQDTDHAGLRRPRLATLFYTRFLHTQSNTNRTRAEILLREALDESQESAYDLKNSLASVIESQGTLDVVEEAVKMRSMLTPPSTPEGPYRQELDLTNSRIRLATLERRKRVGDREPLPPPRHYPLRGLETIQYELASSLTNLANRNIDLDHWDLALESTQRSVQLFDSLHSQSQWDDKFRRGLALARNTYSNILANDGQHTTALEVMEQAVNGWPDSSDASLSLLLYSNLFLRHAALGNENEVRAAMAKVTALGDSSLQDNDDLKPELARCLLRVSASCTRLGLHENAVANSLKGIAILRELARENDAGSKQDLAQALVGHSAYVLSLGRPKDAFEYVEEGLQIYQGAMRGGHTSVKPDLAVAFYRAAVCHRELGQYEEAFKNDDEALKIWRGLAGHEKKTEFTSYLSSSLSNIAIDLLKLKRQEEALERSQEALDIQRRLVDADPVKFNPGLVQLLNNNADLLDELGLHDVALKHNEEALAIQRRIVGDNNNDRQNSPISAKFALAYLLNSTAADLRKLGRLPEALEHDTEAVKTCRELVSSNRTMFDASLATSLQGAASDLQELERHDEAGEYLQEALSIWKTLADGDPAQFNAGYSLSLCFLADNLTLRGKHREALPLAKYAVEFARAVDGSRVGGRFKDDLAYSLSTLSVALTGVGELRDACVASEESVELCRQLVAVDPRAYRPDLAETLRDYARPLSGRGQHREALAAVREARDVYEELVLERPVKYRRELEKTLEALSEVSVKAEQEAGELEKSQAAAVVGGGGA